MSEEQKKPVEETPEQQEKQQEQVSLKRALKQMSGFPTPQEVEALKQQHGEIYSSVFSETEAYIWRPMTRAEYTQLQRTGAEQNLSPLEYEEMVAEHLVVWPQGVDWSQSKGGTLSTLHEQIQQNSNFATPAMAAAMVVRL